MDAGAAQPGLPAKGTRRRRALAIFAAVLLLGALALRVFFAVVAADLFRAAVARAAAASGVAVAFDTEPSVSASGFVVRGLRVRGVAGDELLSADAVSGELALAVSSPFVRLSLELTGARARWPIPKPSASAAQAPDAGGATWPAMLSRVVVQDARVDFGGGRAASFDATIEQPSAGGQAVTASRLDYTDDSGTFAAEKLAGTLNVTPNGELASRVDLRIDSGAALASAVLLDFGAQPLHASAVLSSLDGGGRRVTDLALAFGGMLSLSGRVDLAADSSLRGADVVVGSEDLGPAFVMFVRDPFGGVVPAIADASVDGRGRLALRFDAPSRHAMHATLSLTLASLKTRAVEADAVELELPWTGATRRSGEPREGRVRAKRLVLLSLPWSGLDATLVGGPGRLRSRAPLTSKAFGGTLHVSEFLFEDDAAKGPRLSASLRVDGLDLAQAGAALGWTGLAGSVHGDLGRVTVDAEAVHAEGGFDVEVFGGQLRLSRILVEGPFSRVPSFGLDAMLSEIDLAKLTQALGVGRVQGVLEGRVSGLQVADGQPQVFDADLHTVSRRGVPQNVDVRAIVQLGVLGGADSGSITGTLLKMVDRYRYSELGLRARLRNDVFELRGVRSEGGRDYLVKGSLLPPSVSVVSHSQVVSFSEMLRRIQRIAAIGEEGAPNAETP